MVEISDEEFEEVVARAYEDIPREMLGKLDNVALFVEDQPAGIRPRLFGLYQGHPVTRRAYYGYGQLPDRITLFRNNIAAASTDMAELRRRVYVTLVHEIGHYYGMSDARLHELGWA